MPTSLPSRTTDPFGFEQRCQIGELHRVGDGDYVGRHDVLHLAAMRLDVLSGEIIVRRNCIEPPGAPVFDPTLGPRLGAMQEITLAHDPNQLLVWIDDGHPADPSLGKKSRQRLHRRVGIDRDHMRCHDIHGAHPGTSMPIGAKIS
jgi:hypothetical protein